MIQNATTYKIQLIVDKAPVDSIQELDSPNDGSKKFNFIIPETQLSIKSEYKIRIQDLGNNYLFDKSFLAGQVITVAGIKRGTKDGDIKEAMFFWPIGLVVDSHGNVYVADTSNNKIKKNYKNW